MQALDYLDSLQGSGIRPGLSRMRTLLRALKHPEQTYRSIVVAGTNGKGSTSAMIASILRESGYRTGLYTSPHLVDIHERWQIDGEPAGDGVLEEAVEALRRASQLTGITATYFEALTVVAFVVFRIAGCEIAVLEVGMGGRLDATNVVKPLASVITPIGLDHMEYLGTTIRSIASEKAGIIHRGAVVLTSNDDAVVLEVIRRRAAKFGLPVQVVTGEHEAPLPGDFQRRNAALAVATAHALMPQLPRITDAAIERGVASTHWKGRLQHLLARGKDVWIDGGHNAHAARAIAPFIRERVASPRTLVFGIMTDKDLTDVANILFPLFDEVIATEPYPPRSATAASLAALATAMGIPATAIPSPEEAIERGLEVKGRSLFIAGSLYLAGAAIAHFD